MKTIYIDIYFLINFCVDLLSLCIATYFVKLKCGVIRLIVSGIIGALYAVMGILFSDISDAVMPVLSVVLFLVMILVVTKGISLHRKIKYAIAFLITEILIGGLVYYGYCFLDKIMKSEDYIENSSENRKLLLWSIIVLLSYGVVKLIMYLFGNVSSLRTVRLCVGIEGREESFEALVDTGNLAKDPSGMRPVVFITGNLARKILKEDADFLNDIEKAPLSVKKRVRLIPVNKNGETVILYGFLSDYVTAVKDRKYENINVTFAVDMKGDLYGGYQALIPAAALDNVF